MSDSIAFRLRRFANVVLHPLGLHLSRRDRAFEMTDLLENAHRRGVRPGTIIDIGASDGAWTLRARRVFPQAQFVLFEPLQERQNALNELQRRHGFHIIPAAAGAASGMISFRVDPALDGSAVSSMPEADDRTVPLETIDAVVERLELEGPYCLKLDTHGYELPVLEGAARALGQTELLIVEAYNFDLSAQSVRFPALCHLLEAQGFRCVDLADPMRRSHDGALWQLDIAFARITHPVFSINSYSER